MTTILDPTDERVPLARKPTPRNGKIQGSVALLDISKPRGNVFLNQLEVLIQQQLPNVKVNRYSKPTFTKPAPESLRQEIKANNQFMVEALAD